LTELLPIIGSSGKPGTPTFVSKKSEVMKFQWRHISATNLPCEEQTLKKKGCSRCRDRPLYMKHSDENNPLKSIVKSSILQYGTSPVLSITTSVFITCSGITVEPQAAILFGLLLTGKSADIC
jgi:hypothetical protein